MAKGKKSHGDQHFRPVAFGDSDQKVRLMTPVLSRKSVKSTTSEDSAKALAGRVQLLHGPLPDAVSDWFKERSGRMVQGALAFVPWILQQAYRDNGTSIMEKGQIVIHRGEGAVLFLDASGVTALTERLVKKSTGAGMLAEHLEDFFGELIAIISAYRGDVVKFSGDALVVYFPNFDDTRCAEYQKVEMAPHGSYGRPDLGPMATAVLRASACCIETHRQFRSYDTGVDGVKLRLHLGVGCGAVHILQLGGQVPPENKYPRFEFIIAGSPLKQASEAARRAKTGQTCLSEEARSHVRHCVVGSTVQEEPSFYLLEELADDYTFPTVRYAAKIFDNRPASCFGPRELSIIRRFIPSAVFKQIQCGTLPYVNETRNISAVSIQVRGLDVMSDAGAEAAQSLMAMVQRICYQHEGTVNKLLMQDEGLTFLLVYGLPPLVHTDDPTRAVLACFDIAKEFQTLELRGSFGITTGRSYCGLYGSVSRREYTVVGDCVDLSKRLMGQAQPGAILCDEETKNTTTTEVIWYALAPICADGQEEPISIFCPEKKPQAERVGLSPDDAEENIHFPWYDNAFGGLSLSAKRDLSTFRANVLNLCSIKAWEGICQAQKLLGGSYDKDIYTRDEAAPVRQGHAISPSAMTPGRGRGRDTRKAQQLAHSDSYAAAPPSESPFATGGVVVIEGETGTGKIELAEYIVMYSRKHHDMVPVFATMGPRPCGGVRLASELLRSILGVYRDMDESVVSDDKEALEQVLARVMPGCDSHLLTLCQAAVCEHPARDRRSRELLDAVLPVACNLLSALAMERPVLIVMQFEHGTSRFPGAMREDLDAFWSTVEKLYQVVQEGFDGEIEPLCMLLLLKDADPDQAVADDLLRAGIYGETLLHLDGLPEDVLLQYMSVYLDVPPEGVDLELAKLVLNVSKGNPLHVRETIDELKHKHLSRVAGQNWQSSRVDCNNIDKVDIASWSHTAMVSGTVSKLEGLDPLEAAIVKMSLCFEDTFTLTDLAARACSRWAEGTTLLDRLLLYSKILKLAPHQGNRDHRVSETAAERPRARYDLISRVSKNQSETCSMNSSLDSAASDGLCGVQHFQMESKLIRSVGNSMMLAAQKMAVKRQALIDRRLQRELPGRKAWLERRKKVTHIPWYYEQAFRRMMAAPPQGEPANPSSTASQQLRQQQQNQLQRRRCCVM